MLIIAPDSTPIIPGLLFLAGRDADWLRTTYEGAFPHGNFPSILTEFYGNEVKVLEKANANYGESWCKRGGIGAFMVLVRKFDRMYTYAQKKGTTDLIKLLAFDMRAEGIVDDIRDLRRYLFLAEAKMVEIHGPEIHCDTAGNREQIAAAVEKLWVQHWEGLEAQIKMHSYNIFQAMTSAEGGKYVISTIQFIRLTLACAEMRAEQRAEVKK